LFGTNAVDSPTGKSGAIPVSSISPQKRNGIVVGYSVYLGKQGDQLRKRRFFVNRSDAEKFVEERNQTPLPIGELWERRTEILFNLERLRSVKSSLTDVVTYYLKTKFSMSEKKISEVVMEFLEEKQRIGRSQLYDTTMRYAFGHFMDFVGRDRRIGDITRQEITDYVYVRNKHVRSVTKKNYLTQLSVLFNFSVRRDYVTTNPVEKIDRPVIPFAKPHVLTPTEFELLLRKCQTNGWDERIVIFVLVGFCGIRVEEASKLKWSNLDLNRGIVEVPDTVAKKASFRNNPIPPNAMRWLRSVEDERRTGPIIGKNFRSLLRSSFRFLEIDYRKNCVRHSFCSYALASKIWTLSDVVQMMGHGGNPTMVFSHYRNVVSEEDGKKWFGIVPEVS
jgi:integrase